MMLFMFLGFLAKMSRNIKIVVIPDLIRNLFKLETLNQVSSGLQLKHFLPVAAGRRVTNEDPESSFYASDVFFTVAEIFRRPEGSPVGDRRKCF